MIQITGYCKLQFVQRWTGWNLCIYIYYVPSCSKLCRRFW